MSRHWRLAGVRRAAGAMLMLAALAFVSSCGSISAAREPAATPAPGTTAASASEGAAMDKASDLKRTSEGGSVTVDVTWEKGAATAGGALSFIVAMNTHSVDLDGLDLARLAVLRNDAGKEVAPERWEAPKGGHHRSGRLVFPATADGSPLVTAQTKYVELVVRDVAGVKERQFKWELGS